MLSLFLCLVVSLCCPPLRADEAPICSPAGAKACSARTEQGSELKLNVPYLKSYLSDTGKILSSPLRWEGQDWLAAALVVSAAAGFYAYDQDLKAWFQQKRNGTTDDVGKGLNILGNPLYVLPALGAVYLYGEWQESEKARRISLLGTESLIISGAFTAALKFVGHRHRPDSGDAYHRWDGPGFSTSNLSFPSEHASAAFSLARVIVEENDGPYIAPVAYGIASLVALSRLNGNEHWSSDAFMGAAIGYFTAGAVLRYHRKKDGPFSLYPDIGGNRYGLLLSYRF